MKRVIACVLVLILLLCSCAKPGAAPASHDATSPAGTDSAVPAENSSDGPAEAAVPVSPPEDTGAEAEDEPGTADVPEAEEQMPETGAPEEDTPKTDTNGTGEEDASLPEDNSEEPPPEDEPEPENGEGPAEEAPALPYSERTSSTVLTVHGSALEREWYFSVYDLQCLGGAVSADYFSRGKEPQEMTTSYTGILVSYLLEQVIGLDSYKKVTFTASDGYAGSYSQGGVDMSYINEQDPSSTLWMILAWSEDGAPCNLRLVMGQQLEGEYNRTYWIRDVVDMDVRA